MCYNTIKAIWVFTTFRCCLNHIVVCLYIRDVVSARKCNLELSCLSKHSHNLKTSPIRIAAINMNDQITSTAYNHKFLYKQENILYTESNKVMLPMYKKGEVTARQP